MGGVVDFFSGGGDTKIPDFIKNPKLDNSTNLNGDYQQVLDNSRSNVAFDTANSDQARTQQQAFINALAQQAQGQGPSLANAQMQAGLEQSLQNQNSMLASNRGVSPGLAMRMAQQNATNQSLTAAQQGMLGRLNEQQIAQGMLGQSLAGMRGQDLGQSQNVATTQLQNNGLNNQFAASLYGLANQRDLGLLNNQTHAGQANISAQQADAERKRKGVGSMLGTIADMGAGVASLSSGGTSGFAKHLMG